MLELSVNKTQVWYPRLTSATGKRQHNMPDVVAVGHNHLDVTDNNYYYPYQIDSYDGVPMTVTGEEDMVKVLYNKAHENQLDGWEYSNNTNRMQTVIFANLSDEFYN